MKILLINYTDSGGGAAMASVRLAQGLVDQGIDVELWVAHKMTSLSFVRQKVSGRLFSPRIQRATSWRLEQRIIRVVHKTTNPILHSLNLFSLLDVEEINRSDFDLVHLHWVNGNLLSIRDIAKITKPLVWTMHDMWVFCGAEHHPNVFEGDTRFVEGYTQRNRPSFISGLDISRYIYGIKERFLSPKRIHFISPSRFEKDALHASPLFRDHPCNVIPNALSQKVFLKQDKKSCREALGISNDKRVIAFGAAYNIDKGRSIKGGSYLIEALKIFQKKIRPEEYLLVIFGPAHESFVEGIEIPAFFTGFISDPARLSMIYNSSDLFICPSALENLPYTVLEAICCGLPVAAFDTGGIPDLVAHQENGYLARLFDAEDLSLGIEYCLANQERLSQHSLLKAREEFSETKVLEEHVKLYREILESQALRPS